MRFSEFGIGANDGYVFMLFLCVCGGRARARSPSLLMKNAICVISVAPSASMVRVCFCSVLLSCRPMNPITYTNISRSIAQPTASHHLSFALLGNLIAENVPIVSFTKSSSSFFGDGGGGGGGADADVHSCISRAVC